MGPPLGVPPMTLFLYIEINKEKKCFSKKNHKSFNNGPTKLIRLANYSIFYANSHKNLKKKFETPLGVPPRAPFFPYLFIYTYEMGTSVGPQGGSKTFFDYFCMNWHHKWYSWLNRTTWGAIINRFMNLFPNMSVFLIYSYVHMKWGPRWDPRGVSNFF